MVHVDLSEPDAAKKWIHKACKAIHGLKDERDWTIKIYPGEDLTAEDPVPLDELLLDESVVRIIKKNHPDLLVDNKLFDDEETLRLFFGEERDKNLIAALF